MAAPNQIKVELKNPVTFGDETYSCVTLSFPLKGKHYRQVYVEDPATQQMAVLVDLLAAVSDMPRAAFLEIENEDLQIIFEQTAPFVQGAV
jgi:hypothetical protein